jgi:hypothetical protein
MALSPNYGWTEPDNTGLVKNGAQDMRTLGDAIDTSVWNIGFGQAGKNKIINGDFGIWQRGTTFSSMGFAAYTADRFQNAQANTLAVTASQQSFTAGAAPVAGYESAFFHRTVVPANSGSGDYAQLSQRIENVRNYAGQQVTFSFWAKAASGTPKIAIELTQNFGTGGSPSSPVDTYITQVTTSTSWARYTATFTVPSISGKTVGTTANTSFLIIQLWYSAGSSLNSRTGSLGNQANTFDTWGWQIEYGSKATPFQTASGGSPQAELAMCQRYYYRVQLASGGFDFAPAYGYTATTTAAFMTMPLPVTMRIAPTSVDFGGNWVVKDMTNTSQAVTTPFFSINASNPAIANLTVTSTSLVTGRFATIQGNNSAAYIGFSAEL